MKKLILAIFLAVLPLIIPGAAATGEENMDKVIPLDLTSKTVKLNDGNIMPVIGLGTYSITGDECVRSVSSALKNGYRLIDSAYIYQPIYSIGSCEKT